MIREAFISMVYITSYRLVARKPFFGLCDQTGLQTSCSATETKGRMLKFSVK